ncbi:MAG: TlpA family protein disulfide reductase [Candidatus Heimdallarchaeota archaeon]
MPDKYHYLVMKILILGLFILSFQWNAAVLGNASSQATISDFAFTQTDGSVVNLSDFTGKPLIVEWAASWCGICAQNQEAMDELYPLYNDSVHFISISYGGSGDSLTDVTGMKNGGGYAWTFGLDHTNVAGTHQVRNGYLWVLDSNYGLIKEWEYTILQAGAIQSELNPLLSPEERHGTVDDDESLLPFGNIFFVGFVAFTILAVVGIIALRIIRE